MGGKHNGIGNTHSRCRSSGCFKGNGGAVDLVGANPIGECNDFFDKVESGRIKFDVAPTGCRDTCPNQIATFFATDRFEI